MKRSIQAIPYNKNSIIKKLLSMKEIMRVKKPQIFKLLCLKNSLCLQLQHDNRLIKSSPQTANLYKNNL